MNESLAELVKKLRGLDHSGGEWQEGFAGDSHPTIVAYDGADIVGITSGMSVRNRAFVIEVVKALPALLDAAESYLQLHAALEAIYRSATDGNLTGTEARIDAQVRAKAALGRVWNR